MNRFVLIVPLAFSSLLSGRSMDWAASCTVEGSEYSLCCRSSLDADHLGIKAGAGYIVVLVLGTASLSRGLDLRLRASPARIVASRLCCPWAFGFSMSQATMSQP
jgi:hypothetical protein